MVIVWITLSPYAIARIEFSSPHKLNEITMPNSQGSSNEYHKSDTALETALFQFKQPQHNLLAQTEEHNIRGTLRPETVLPRPYKDQKRIRFIEEQNPKRSLLRDNSPNFPVYLFDTKENKLITKPKDYDLGNELVPKEDEMIQYESPIGANSANRDEEKTLPSKFRKRTFVLVQSGNKQIFSVYGDKSIQDEHQAQRPPTDNVHPTLDKRLRRISYDYRYGVPEPTFQSVSTHDLQLEKLDGRYLGASDSTFQQ